jgi:hypothetical protein
MADQPQAGDTPPLLINSNDWLDFAQVTQII